MKTNVLISLALEKPITKKEVELSLYEICEEVHADCDNRCPVYRLNNGKAPDTAKNFQVNRGCDTFKDGKAMRKFIKRVSKNKEH